MDISKIISISGKAGLFKVVSQAKNGLIVESLEDKKREPAYSHYQVSSLEDISIFTTGEDMPLKNVLQKIYDKEKGGPAIDIKSNDEDLKKYFEQALPEYDKDRVYISDIRKVIKWYNQLQKEGLLDAKEEVKADSKTEVKAAGESKIPAKPKASPVKTAVPKPSRSKSTQKTTVRKTGA